METNILIKLPYIIFQCILIIFIIWRLGYQNISGVEFSQALEKYRNQPIRDSINSANPIERMFAILDRRVGKRSLDRIKENLDQEVEWLKPFYSLRLEGEHLSTRSVEC